MRTPTRLLWGFGAIAAVVLTGSLVDFGAEAQPPGPAAFCEVYPEAPACAAGDVSCTTCHVAPPELNAFGLDVSANLLDGEERPLHEDAFTAGLGDALRAVESVDSDQDDYSNLEEIEAGSSPSDRGSIPTSAGCIDLDPDDGYDICGIDSDYLFKKISLDFCGHTPALIDRKQFAEIEDKRAGLHELLDVCLDSEHWRGIDGRVWQLGNAKIGPQQAVKTGKDSGPIPLADYDDDFAYWVWSQTDDRDVRLVLTGKDFVTSYYVDGKTVYEEWARSPNADFALRGYDAYQAVRRPYRAGLLTHRWFLMSNTMFTGIPRTTAAQAYRAFLGLNIARLEGLYPVDGEPVDYDGKGVAEPGCIGCHSTLDPLSYPFSRYEGIGGSDASYESYAYNEYRMEGFVWVDGPLVAETPESGVLFGQPVANVVEWGEVAANSEEFRYSTVRDYWRLLFHEDPRASEARDFAKLVDEFGTRHEHQVERMLHALIDTEAYGAP